MRPTDRQRRYSDRRREKTYGILQVEEQVKEKPPSRQEK